MKEQSKTQLLNDEWLVALKRIKIAAVNAKLTYFNKTYRDYINKWPRNNKHKRLQLI